MQTSPTPEEIQRQQLKRVDSDVSELLSQAGVNEEQKQLISDCASNYGGQIMQWFHAMERINELRGLTAYRAAQLTFLAACKAIETSEQIHKENGDS